MSGDGAPDVVLRGSFDASHQKRYAHVPFQVPEGIRGLEVRYDYSDRIPSDPMLGGGNTLDIGLFDPRGIAQSSPGFRGWSGSEKLRFSVTEAWATPPYTAGPILPGQWHVLLGPYKVGPRGCDYRVEIRFSTQPGDEQPRPTHAEARPPSLPAVAEEGWLRGDLHCHTLHSDGDSWPAEMLARAVETGLDFLGVTDHNQVGHHADYARVTGERLPIVIPGVEVTTYGGHWNAWGTDTWWDFREPEEAAVSRAMQAAAASGALVSINHPKPFGPAWEYPGAEGYHAIEVWNGTWARLNTVSLGWWEQQLRAGRRIVALGGSDTHRLKSRDPDPRHSQHLGSPTTWVYGGGDRSALGVLAGLRAGRVFVAHGPDGPQLYLRSGMALAGDVIRAPSSDRPVVDVRVVGGLRATLALVSERGTELAAAVEQEDWRISFELPTQVAGYIRAQLMDEKGEVLALTNPLYLHA